MLRSIVRRRPQTLQALVKLLKVGVVLDLANHLQAIPKVVGCWQADIVYARGIAGLSFSLVIYFCNVREQIIITQ